MATRSEVDNLRICVRILSVFYFAGVACAWAWAPWWAALIVWAPLALVLAMIVVTMLVGVGSDVLTMWRGRK